MRGFGLRKHIRIIAAGRIFNGFDMIKAVALGADICNSARGFMLSLGCIQALKCNSNHCPVGVATTNPRLYRGLHVASKAQRVMRWQHETVHAFAQMLGAMGYDHPNEIKRRDVFRRLTGGHIQSFEEIYPSMHEEALLDVTFLDHMPHSEKQELQAAKTNTF